MEHQFRESMAGPEWELEDYEWCASDLSMDFLNDCC